MLFAGETVNPSVQIRSFTILLFALIVWWMEAVQQNDHPRPGLAYRPRS